MDAFVTPKESSGRAIRPSLVRDLGARLALHLPLRTSGLVRGTKWGGEAQWLASLVTLSMVAYGLASRLRLLHGFPAGDEPAYLVLSQAMQLYQSIDVMRVYENADYLSYYHGLLEPHVVPGADGRPQTLHQIGGPLLWLLPFMAAGRTGAVAFMAAVSVLCVVNIYYFLRERGITAPYAFIVSAALAIGSPIYVLASMSFVEPIGALATIFAVRVILLERPRAARLTFAAIGTAYLPWVHMRFAPLALSLGLLLILRVWRDCQRTAVWPYVQVLAPLVLSVVLIEVYTIGLYGEIDPMAPQAIYGVKVFEVPMHVGFIGTLFDRNYGLITNFPIFFLVLPGLLLALERAHRETNITLLAVMIPYMVLTVTSTTWWGSYNPPARYPQVLVPVLAFYIALVLQRANRWIVTSSAVLLAVAAYALHLTTDVYPNDRFTVWDLRHNGMERIGDLIGLHFSWLAPSSFLPGQTSRFMLWITAALVIGLLLWWLGRRDAMARLDADPGDLPALNGRRLARSELLPAGASGRTAVRLEQRLSRRRVGLAAVGLAALVAAGGLGVGQSSGPRLQASDIIGTWESQGGGRFVFAHDGSFAATGLRYDVLTYRRLEPPTEHSATPRQSATGHWRLLATAGQIELRFVTMQGSPVESVKMLRAAEWAESYVLYFLVAYPDSNVWYGFFKNQRPMA